MSCNCIEQVPVLGSAEEQLREICILLNGKTNCFYTPLVPLDPSVITTLRTKGYSIIPQNKYPITWIGGTAVRGAMRRVYWIGVPGRK